MRMWLATLALMASLAQAQAQQRAAPPRAPEPAPAPRVEPPPPYEPQLLRLAEIMGALAWLRDLCGQKDGDAWRARMTSLIDAEATTEARKERLAGAWNRGFRGFEATYRACTPNAELVISRYLDEGQRIARDVANRFGGG